MWESERYGANKYGDNVRQESGSRIEKYAYDNRQHCIRNDVDIEYIVRNHERCDYTVKNNQHEQQRKPSLVYVIVFSEQVEVKHEVKYQHTYKKNLTHNYQPALSG